MAIINESGMCFGEYHEEDIFRIEEYSQHQKNLMPHGVKSCEFILKKDQALYFLEAKTSSPNQITADSGEEKVGKYNAYIADITNKMRHSLALYASILLKQHSGEGIPQGFLKADLSKKEIKLVLVVKKAEREWLMPLQDKLRKELKPELKIWKVSDFFVINEECARNKHFVI